ncbi:MAG: hypothetical protein JTJ18_00475, partial [Streptococcus sp.]|nr:hypothetical protein [Streptococcus sp.]
RSIPLMREERRRIAQIVLPRSALRKEERLGRMALPVHASQIDVQPNERFWHENALFLEKKVRKSAFSCHFKEKYRNFAVEPKH